MLAGQPPALKRVLFDGGHSSITSNESTGTEGDNPGEQRTPLQFPRLRVEIGMVVGRHGVPSNWSDGRDVSAAASRGNRGRPLRKMMPPGQWACKGRPRLAAEFDWSATSTQSCQSGCSLRWRTPHTAANGRRSCRSTERHPVIRQSIAPPLDFNDPR